MKTHMRQRRIYGKGLRTLLFLLMLTAMLAGISSEGQAAAYKPKVSKETVTIKGLKKTQKILFVSDMHIVAKNDSAITSSTKKRHDSRYKAYTFAYGTTAKAWLKLCGKLDSYGADLIIFGGDMIDYCSDDNIKILKEGLEKVQTPYILLCGNHEGNDWALSRWDTVDSVLRRSGVYSTDTVLTRNMKGFRVICINEKDNSISDSTVTSMKKLLNSGKKGKPVILFSHVPLQCGEHVYLSNASKVIGTAYAKTSPVVASFSGHVHFYQVLRRRADLLQISLMPAFKQYITMITVQPAGAKS